MTLVEVLTTEGPCVLFEKGRFLLHPRRLSRKYDAV